MKQFINSLKHVIKIIQENSDIEENSFDLIALSNLQDIELQQIREEVANIKLVDVDEFWDLTELIYKKLTLKTILPELCSYFKSTLITRTQKPIEITYQFNHWFHFILKANNSTNVHLYMKKDHAEKQLQNLLDYLQIKDLDWKNHLYDFDYAFNFESEIEALFRELSFLCWEKAKKETNTNIKGYIQEYNGGSHMYDLDDGSIMK